MSRSERDARHRIRVKRENEDRGLRECLAQPTGRAFIWWLYMQCGMRERQSLAGDGVMAALRLTELNGKQHPGRELENRCKLVDHRNWLLTLAENDDAWDDGRLADKEIDREGEE